MESWEQCKELLDQKILNHTPFNLDEIVTLVRHLPIPWSADQPRKAYVRHLAKERAARLGVELSFDWHRNALFAESREQLLHMIYRTEAGLRTGGKRLARLSMKLSEQNRLPRYIRHSVQMRLNVETGALEAPQILDNASKSVSPAKSVVPLRPFDDDSLWARAVSAFTDHSGGTMPTFPEMMVSFVRQQLGAVVPEEIWREDMVPTSRLLEIHRELTEIMAELVDVAKEVQKPSSTGD